MHPMIRVCGPGVCGCKFGVCGVTGLRMCACMRFYEFGVLLLLLLFFPSCHFIISEIGFILVGVFWANYSKKQLIWTKLGAFLSKIIF